MGSGDWFNIIIRKKNSKHVESRTSKDRDVQQPHTSKLGRCSSKTISRILSGGHSRKHPFANLPSEDVAAVRIQKAFRAFKARKALRALKGRKRLIALTQNHSTSKQAPAALNSIQSWSRIHVEISARRQRMVTEGRIKQRKLESQLKVEAKLHDIEADWCGGSETMEDIVERIQQREEAAVRRERALAYAFSHQWRPSSGQNQGQFIYELGKFNWGWSWMDRWIAARPWEARIPMNTSTASKGSRKTSAPIKKFPSFVKRAASSGNGSMEKPHNTMPAKNTKSERRKDMKQAS